MTEFFADVNERIGSSRTGRRRCPPCSGRVMSPLVGVAGRWKLGDVDIIEPGPLCTASADVRGAYAMLREAS